MKHLVNIKEFTGMLDCLASNYGATYLIFYEKRDKIVYYYADVVLKGVLLQYSTADSSGDVKTINGTTPNHITGINSDFHSINKY